MNAFPMVARCAARQYNPSIHGPSEWTPEACACGDPKWQYYKVCALCEIKGGDALVAALWRAA